MAPFVTSMRGSQAAVARLCASETDSRGVVALLAALALHGPLDIVLTVTYWSLESNPLVVALGLWPWVALKIVALVALVAVWSVVRDHWLAAWSPRVLVVLGLALVAPNIVIATVGGAI